MDDEEQRQTDPGSQMIKWSFQNIIILPGPVFLLDKRKQNIHLFMIFESSQDIN